MCEPCPIFSYICVTEVDTMFLFSK